MLDDFCFAFAIQVSDHKKGTSSTSGMGTSVKTSELLKYRAEHVVPKRMTAIVDAIEKRDFDTFGRITMQVCRWARRIFGLLLRFYSIMPTGVVS
jgi:mevalonate pyrophosphate decarboxylase